MLTSQCWQVGGILSEKLSLASPCCSVISKLIIEQQVAEYYDLKFKTLIHNLLKWSDTLLNFCRIYRNFFRCVWPFWEIMHYGIDGLWKRLVVVMVEIKNWSFLRLCKLLNLKLFFICNYGNCNYSNYYMVIYFCFR